MVIVRLKGGFGNQLFQYAAARRIAVEQNVPLKLDLSFLVADAIHHTKRHFELYKLNINAEIATAREIQAIKKERWRDLLHPVLIKDRGAAAFLKQVTRCRDQVYLDGYWQSEKYFETISGIIRNEFIFKQPLVNEYYLHVKRQEESSDSVSLHFRRGDYVEDPKTNKYHGVCSMDYYRKAVERISEKISNPVLFIFSDDIQWVKAHFKSKFPMVFIEHSDEELHSDFRLMSSCKHNIIANSSYSWWAAWLNTNPGKIVVAPRMWYNNKRKQRQANDRVPDAWMRV